MKKIISLFQRNYDTDRLVRDEIVPGAEWVVNGEGVATVKWDGTACLVRDGKLYKRYDAKKGRTPPAGWEPCEDAPDPNTGHWPGWLPIGEGPEDKWYREAWDRGDAMSDWTYELIGPHFQSNPYGYARDAFIAHGMMLVELCPRDFAGLKAWFTDHDIEGVVWWRDLSDVNCDKVKIKRRDFGLPWPAAEGEK
jgi:hypothetical protein